MSEEPNLEERIVETLLGLPPDQRGGYMDQACGQDDHLRELVKALLRAHEQIGAVLRSRRIKRERCDTEGVDKELCPASQPGTLHPDGADAAAPLAPASGAAAAVNSASIGPFLNESPEGTPVVDGYALRAEIGRGGMGVVYLAEQTRPFRRRVALKLIKLGMDTKQVIARFEAERQALALMEHPNVAKVFGAGASATGRPYFVMELVHGPRITDYCDQYSLSTRERLGLFLQVCRAIQHAHQKGIIHRDIKPSNILVAQQDGAAVPKVIDFGIAKATAGGVLSDKTVVSSFEQFLGTPAYSSPEQAEGNGDVDTRTDIYSLGVLLYEMLVGKTPFDSKELRRAGWDNMRRTIRETEPVRPSTRLATLAGDELSRIANSRRTEPPRLIHALRGDLDWIIMKCLEKDRAGRYATCNGIAADIERHLNNEPVVARPPSELYRFQKLVRRNRLIFSAGAVAAAALVTGLGVAIWAFLAEKQARHEAFAAQVAAQAAEESSQTREKEARASEARARAALDFFRDTSITRKFPPGTRQAGPTIPATLSRPAATEPELGSNQLSAGLPLSFSNQTALVNSAVSNNPAQSSSAVPATGPDYPQLAGEWSKWSMELPLTNSAGAIHPSIDSYAFDVTEGQFDSMLFLSAPFGTVARSCVVPPDTWLFFGLLTIESSNVEGPPFFGQTAQDQAAVTSYFAAHIVGLFCDIDGVPVPDLRSYHFIAPQIPFTAPTPWIFGNTGGTGTSVIDGYFLKITPFGSGPHTLHYGGAFQFRTPADPFDLDVPMDMTYYLTVP